MKRWPKWPVFAALLALIAVLGLAANSLLGSRQASGIGPEALLRPELHPELLTVRYFYLPGAEKTGDSILIISPEGRTLLIDTGIPAAGGQVVHYLNQMGIEHLDTVLLTHPHIDHIGGFPAIARFKSIGQVMMINFAYSESSSYRNLMQTIQNQSIPLVYIEEGDSFTLGQDVHFQVLSPPKGFSSQDVANTQPRTINHFSSVVRMSYGDTSFLFTGDIYKQKEFELIASSWKDHLRADLLHAPHHGSSDTSNSEAFIRAVSPKVTMISANIGSLIDPIMIRRYQASGSQVYVTGMHGTTLVVSDGKELRVVTEFDGAELLQPAG